MIAKECIDKISTLISEGDTVLEIGSGPGTELLLEKWKVISIENYEPMLGEYHDDYIYAPIVPFEDPKFPRSTGWFDTNHIKVGLKDRDYDLIYVDGPAAFHGRGGFAVNISLFKDDVPMVFDDVNRRRDRDVMVNVANRLGRKWEMFPVEGKKFGVVYV